MQISDFQALVGERITFINPIGRTNSVPVTAKNAYELYKLQEDGYTFKQPVRIHNVMQECESCSA